MPLNGGVEFKVSPQVQTQELSSYKKFQLFKIGNIYLQICRLVGYFPYQKVSRDNVLEFKWVSLVTIYQCLVIISTTIAPIILTPVWKSLEKQSGYEHSSTDIFSFYVVYSTSVVFALYLRTEAIFHAKRYVEFWNELESAFQLIVLNRTTQRSPHQMNDEIKNLHRYLKWFIAIAIGLVVIYVVFIVTIFGPFLLFKHIDLSISSFALGVLLMASELLSIAHVFNSILCSFIIRIFQYFYFVIGKPLTRKGARTASATIKPDQVLEQESHSVFLNQVELYFFVDDLVEKFNTTFGSKILMEFATFVITFTANVYGVLSELTNSADFDFKFALVAIPYILLHIVVFAIFGERATNMTKQAQNCIKNFNRFSITSNSHKIVKMGSFPKPAIISAANYFTINRRLLTAITGTITTYMVILLQFRSEDKK